MSAAADDPGRPIRVAIDGRVIDDHFPGIGRYVYRLVEALAELPDEGGRPLELQLLYRPQAQESRFDLATLAKLPGLSLHPLDAPVFGPASEWRIPRALRALDADLWHATYWLGTAHAGRPTVLTLYDLIGRNQPGSVPGLRSRLLALALKRAIHAADRLITISEAAAIDIRAAGLSKTGSDKVGQAKVDHGKVDHGKASDARAPIVTPLAADAHFRPAPASEIAALRARLDLPERFLLYLGINKPHKNLNTLVDAWARLVDGRPELFAASKSDGDPAPALIIAGRWDARYPEAREAAQAMPEQGRPRFIGPVEEADLPALYSACLAFVFPSRYEGFGLPPLEAMACGRPVIAAAATSLPEIVGEAGLLVPPLDADAWATAMARVLSEPKLVAELGTRSLARAAEFSWAETARRTRAVYRELAGLNEPGIVASQEGS